MSTTVVTVVLLQNCIDLRSSGRNVVIHIQLEGVLVVTKEENQEPTTSPLTDLGVGFILLRVEHASSVSRITCV